MKSPESTSSNNISNDPSQKLLTHDTRLDREGLNKQVLDAALVYEDGLRRVQENIGGVGEGFARAKARMSLITMNQVAGVAPYMTKTQSEIQSFNASSGFELMQNQEAVALVVADMRRQEEVQTEKLSLLTVDENGVYVLDNEDEAFSEPLSSNIGELKVPQLGYVKAETATPDSKAPLYDLDENIIRQQAAFDNVPASNIDEEGPGKAVFANMADQLSKYGNSIEFTDESNPSYRIIKNDDHIKDGVEENTLDNHSEPTKMESVDINSEKRVDIDLNEVEARALKEEQDKITVNNFTSEEQARKKAEWLASRVEEVQKTISKPVMGGEYVYPSSVDIDLTEMEKKAQQDKTLEAKSGWEINGPIENWGEDPGFVRLKDGDVAPIKELIGELSKQENVAETVTTTETVEKKRRMSEEEYNAQVEIWRKNLEGAKVAVENAERVLLASREKSQESLKSMGLTNIEKGLAAWKKVRPGYKMALGLTLAASGLGAVSVGLSALTFTEKGYSERREALAKEGKKESKYWTLTKSAGIGILLALGTSHLSHLAGEAMSEHMPGIMDKIHGFFGGSTAPAPSPDSVAISPTPELHSASQGLVDNMPSVVDASTPDTVMMPEAGIDASPEFVPEPATDGNPDIYSGFDSESVTPEIVTPDAITPDITSPIDLNQTYVMQPGDTTDSILRRVLGTVPELQALPEEGKLKFISDLKEQWSTTISGASSPNWALKEMLGGATGTEVHHLDHVKNAFVTLGERADIIQTFRK